MNIRNKMRIFTFSLALIMALFASSMINMTEAKMYKKQLEVSYQHSLNELSESLDSIETNLTKCVYSGSDSMLSELSRDLYSRCTQASEALSRLPVEHMNLGSTYKFISQASDFAMYISDKASYDEEITPQEHQALLTLLGYAQKLNEAVNQMVDVCNSGGEILTVKNDKSISVNPLTNDFGNAEEAFEDYPTLLYDGPFADAVLNRSAQMTKNKDAYSKEQARDIAANAISKNPDELSYIGNDEGNLECYVFSCAHQTIGVTKYGGYVAYILYGGRIAATSVTEENAVNIAKAYLDSIGYEDMAETYYMSSGNICVINFSFRQNDITYYSDLIKVGISLNDGNVVSMEAKGYLTNHIDRKPFNTEISISDAKDKLNPYLEILNTKMCVIPNDDATESECYEFHCRSSETGEEVLVYTNVHTGKEQNILLLLYSDGGTLTK